MKKFWKFVWVILIAFFMFWVTNTLIEDERTTAYAEGYDAGYQAASEVFLKSVARPQSGKILAGRQYEGSEITVTADSSNDYVVSLKDWVGDTCVSFYVRAGDTVTVGVPSKYLYVYFASGKTWYGYGENLMFGPNTYYSKDDEALDFDEYAWEYTLYPVTDGNFSETPCSADDFF